MPSGLLLLTYLIVQRTIELAIARRHTKMLIGCGGYEEGAAHYPAMVLLHASWLVTLCFLGWNHTLQLAWLVPFLLLQALRFWVLRTLGKRWTTRIIILPGVPPIASGPYRFVRHPNYAVVACELPCASLALHLEWHAALFGALNITMLDWRIRSENEAFARAGGVTR